MNNNKIYVTAPSLAPLEEFTELLKQVWDNGILTHNGPLVQQLESDLENKLGVENLSLVTNGTIALQLAIRALGVTGEIITTPFSWIATLSAIQWENCKPIFCDIDPETLNIDVNRIEQHISKNTIAILPVHVFGNPCEVEEIQKIANKHDLKVIYDAAHAVGSTYNQQSVLNYGDLSATSLHATKLLNTAEGGAIVANTGHFYKTITQMRFFGFNNKLEVDSNGTNAKMTEIHAALGIANIQYLDGVIRDRKEKYFYYRNKLSGLKNISFQTIKYGEPNYSYFPLILSSEEYTIKVLEKLANKNIIARRYFYPSINTYSNVIELQSCPISEDISKRIICLPLYYNLTFDDIDLIITTIKESLRNQ